MKRQTRRSALFQLTGGGATLACPQSLLAAVVAGYTPIAATTWHEGVFGGVRTRYCAVVQETPIGKDAANPSGSIGSIAYIRDPVDPRRPVLFAFNGGPGSSSFLLHMGALGPRLAAASNEPSLPPYALRDNGDALLDLCDLVFVDPIGSGYSRILGGQPSDFYGTDGDAQSIADFIQQWTERHQRWASPRLLLGESYGTLRALLVAERLFGGAALGSLPAIAVNAIAMVSQILWGVGNPGLVDDMHQAALLPSYTAAAIRHGRIAGDPASAVGEAQRFADGPYIAALAAGNRISETERSLVAVTLARLTGIDEAIISAGRLRIAAPDFAARLLEKQGKRLSLYDTRMTVADAGRGADPVADDPATGQVSIASASALRRYLVEELGVRTTRRYEIANFAANAAWQRSFGDAMTDRVAELSSLAAREPSLRLFVAAGEFDLVTSAGAARIMVDHSGIPAERVTFRTYPAGHEPYADAAALGTFQSDLRAFVNDAVQAGA